MPDDVVNSPPRLPPDITRERCIQLWIDLCETSEALLLAGLRREVGPDGDVRAAYRAWRERWSAEHDKKWENMARKMAQKDQGNDRP